MTDQTNIVAWTNFKHGIIWVNDYHDWPLAGVAMFEGRRIYFNCVETWYVDDQEYRRFGLYDPPPGIWLEIDARHEAFCKYVGTHWNYVEGKRGPHMMKPEPEWHKFYDVYPPNTAIEMQEEWRIGTADSSLDGRRHE